MPIADILKELSSYPNIYREDMSRLQAIILNLEGSLNSFIIMDWVKITLFSEGSAYLAERYRDRLNEEGVLQLSVELETIRTAIFDKIGLYINHQHIKYLL